MTFARGVGLALLLAVPAAGQARWTLVGADAAVRVEATEAGGERPAAVPLVLHGPRAFAAPEPPLGGRCTVGFAVDALGQPEPLVLDVPPGADVHVAVDAAGPAVQRDVAPDGDHWTEATAGRSVRVTGDAEQRDYRVAASWNVPPATSGTGTGTGADDAVGLVARWGGPADHYAFVCLARGGFRLERRMGGHAMVLANVAGEPLRGAPLRLAFEVAGFRLRGLLGDRVVVEALDGALTGGRFGWCWHGERPALAAMSVGAPAPARTSVALVREAGPRATLHVAGPMPHGHWAALELRVDRPGPLVPTTEAGLEPWLSRAPVWPHVLGVPALQRLGQALAEVPVRGQLACRLEWPDLGALRGQVALARFLFVAADGSLVASATPSVPLRL